jgi:general secretion pathway protein G
MRGAFTMLRKYFRSSQQGFTLIEILIAITIMVMFAGGITTVLVRRAQTARLHRARLDIENLALPLDLYATDNGFYPTTEQGLDSLLRTPTTSPEALNWNGPYVKNTEFKDPWGSQYVYRSPSIIDPDLYEYDLYSYGPNQQDEEGSGDDIASWLTEE